MVEGYKKFWINYTKFDGCSSRADYWWTLLANIIVAAILGFVFGLISSVTGIKAITFIPYLYTIAIIIPDIALSIRRLHDINKSGWFLLIALLPLIGSIILLVFYCLPSVDEDNKYGDIVE